MSLTIYQPTTSKQKLPLLTDVCIGSTQLQMEQNIVRIEVNTKTKAGSSLSIIRTQVQVPGTSTTVLSTSLNVTISHRVTCDL